MKCKLQFYEASGRLEARDIAELIPITFPMAHALDQHLYPGAVQFPNDDWEAGGRPCWAEASWVALSMKVATHDMGNLEASFEFCSKATTTIERPIALAQTHYANAMSGAASSPIVPSAPFGTATMGDAPESD